MANGQKRQCDKKINEEQKTTILCTKSTIRPQKQIKQKKIRTNLPKVRERNTKNMTQLEVQGAQNLPKVRKNTKNKAILGVGCPKERHNDEKNIQRQTTAKE